MYYLASLKNIHHFINKIEGTEIIGSKALDFADFCKASKLIKDKAHLTESGLENIRLIKAGMNRGRKS